MSVLRSNRAATAEALPVVRRLSPAWLAVVTLASAMLAARAAHAAPVIDRTLFTWSGRVDREVYIVMRGRNVRTTGVDARLPNRARVNDALPRGRGDVLIRVNDGRGRADVVEQPSARNGYSTTIRITDPRAGADSYRVTAYWTGDDRFDDRRRTDRDDRYDRDDDDRDRDRRGNGPPWNRDRRDGGWDDRGRDDRGRDDRGRDDRGDRGDNGTLRWSGRVDDVVEIRITGRRVESITRSGVRVSDVSSNIRGDGLPSRSVTVEVEQLAGRGSIRVVQQPSAWNGYTAVIRIDDPSGGASFHDFRAFW